MNEFKLDDDDRDNEVNSYTFSASSMVTFVVLSARLAYWITVGGEMLTHCLTNNRCREMICECLSIMITLFVPESLTSEIR